MSVQLQRLSAVDQPEAAINELHPTMETMAPLFGSMSQLIGQVVNLEKPLRNRYHTYCQSAATGARFMLIAC